MIFAPMIAKKRSKKESEARDDSDSRTKSRPMQRGTRPYLARRPGDNGIGNN